MITRSVYTVIVADDEEEIRESVCTMVPWEELGFQLVGEASNGLDALQLVEEREPDLLLTDIRMPFISGIELARQVREVRPATHIAFLSGYDDFEYAKQAIEYNIISYMLKPLTMEGLSKELTAIHNKIDAQFATFRQSALRSGGPDPFAALLMPLVLDSDSDPEGEERVRDYAVQYGLLVDEHDRPEYTVMASILLDENGANATSVDFVASVNTLAGKYLRSVSFFASGKVITILMGSEDELQQYLHILADEIPQVASRVLGKGCRIGISRNVEKMTALHEAYRQALEALTQGDKTEVGARFISDLESPVRGVSRLCRRALETLDQRYMEPDLSLVSLSTILEVSPNHLSACIKKQTGETFINILIRKRMEAAQDLLTHSTLKVQEISRRCGYTDQHYFSYCFKKYCGESPNAMRRRLDMERAGGLG